MERLYSVRPFWFISFGPPNSAGWYDWLCFTVYGHLLKYP